MAAIGNSNIYILAASLPLTVHHVSYVATPRQSAAGPLDRTRYRTGAKAFAHSCANF